MISQAEEGMKLFEAQQGSAAEVDTAGAETLDRLRPVPWDAHEENKKERAAKGKEVAELKAEQCYVDACKIVKGLEPKFGYFVTKPAEAPKQAEKEEARADGVAFPPFLQEQGMSGGQQNKDEEVVKMVARMNELKEKQDPGSTKKEKDGPINHSRSTANVLSLRGDRLPLLVPKKGVSSATQCHGQLVRRTGSGLQDAKKDSKKKTPLSAEEQKEFAQLQNEIEIYKAKLRSEFGYSSLARTRSWTDETREDETPRHGSHRT
eukprot:g10292.t1